MGFCDLCDREHKASWRQFAHACHFKDTVCWARAANTNLVDLKTDLTDAEIDGITAHELGHIVANELGLEHHRKTRRRTKGVEDEANFAAAAMGFVVRYNSDTLPELVSAIEKVTSR